MLTRIGDAAQQARMLSSIMAVQTRLREAQIAASSGNAATRYTEIADDTALVLSTKHELRVVETRIAQNRHVLERMRVADGALATLEGVASSARNLILQRLDGTVGRSVPFLPQIDDLLAEVENQLNLRFDDRYLFAGSRNDVAPVALPDPPPTVPDPTLYYQGDSLAPRVRADDGTEIVYAPTAADAAFADLIGAMGAARQADIAGDDVAMRTALSQLSDAIAGLADMRGEFGAKAARIETIIDAKENMRLYMEEVVGDIEGVDLPMILSRIAHDQASLEASYMTIAKLSQLSLTDFIR